MDKSNFTTSKYEELISLAKEQYKFIPYKEITYDEKFVLWRHDVDFSLNRSLRLAEIENQYGVLATYFLNPHCEFYNLLEKTQFDIIHKILLLGHEIGLHFDAEFHDISNEEQLDKNIAHEAKWLSDLFGVNITAFSFHNPTQFLLGCERDHYGGLINCYSKTFKTRIDYCSDSNGYWRHRPIRDVILEASSLHLQILTHPGWWQETEMSPRNRIARCTQGRANAVLDRYDVLLEKYKRLNIR